MTYSDYPHGFEHGVTIRNIPVDIAVNPNANIYWVDSVNGNNENRGTCKRPFGTLIYALSRCISNNGDIIYLAAGHNEAITDATTHSIDINGVTIICLGEGSNRATLTYSTTTAATLIVAASNVTLINPRFVCNVDALIQGVDILGTNCKIYNAEWHDSPAKATLIGIAYNNAAIGAVIDGYKYYESTTGTQKTQHIYFGSPSTLSLRNIDITGDFSAANISNFSACTALRLENIKLKNKNVSPAPGIILNANSTGQAKNIDIRIVSGTTYVSSVAKLNWDNNCLGYNADGTGGDPIGTSTGGSIEAKVDAIQADIGDPSARSNGGSIELMLGLPDAPNSTLSDMIYTGFDSTAVVPGANGSVMERLEVIQAALASPQGDFYKVGTCDAGMVDSKTTVVAADLAGFGDDFFNTKYYMQVILNSSGVGTAPETEIRQITNYVSTTGTFTVNAFSQNVQAADKVAIIHQSLISGTNPIGTDIATILAVTNAIPDAGALTTLQSGVTTISTNVGDASGDTLTSVVAKLGNSATTVAADFTTVKAAVAKIDGGSIAAAPTAGSLATFIATGGVALGTALDNSKSIVDALGSNGTTVASNTSSVGGQVLLTKAEALKIDSATLAVNPTAGSLARFIASGGTALGTPLADSKSLINAIGTDGTTAAAATAASAASLFGAIGTNEADAATPFSSSNVQANADGTVLEREEFIQDAVTKIDAATLAVSPTAGSLATFIASGGTALGTALAASKSIVDAIGSNGSALVYGSGSILGAIGTSFWIKKTMTSSAILESAPVDITAVSSGGELAIEDVVVKTDSTGLAGGTNFEIKTDNAKGELNFFVETVANLGASKTVAMHGASVTGEHTVVETGKKIQVHATVSDCTGAGTIDIYIKFTRLAAGATIAAL